MLRSIIIIRTLILVSALLLTPGNLYAKHYMFDITFRDSLVADNETNILFNDIVLSNPGKKTITVALAIIVPGSWTEINKTKYLEGKEVYYQLSPGQTKKVPVNLIRNKKTSAQWDSVEVMAWIPNVTDTQYYYCHLRAQPDYKFHAQYITEDIYLEDRPEKIALSVSIKNTGNVIDTYKLRWQNYQMELNEDVQITLAPGQDSIYTHVIKVPHSSWAGLYNNTISLSITGGGRTSYSHTYKISRPKSYVRQFESSYPVIPLTTEVGTIVQGAEQYYYVGARGNVHFGEEHDLFFNYRSKQFGSELYGIQRNMYLVDYRYHRWKCAVGLVPQFQRFFASSGRGAALSYKMNEKTEIAFAAILSDPNFYYTGNNFSLMIKYPLKKLGVKHILSSNFDPRTAVNGQVLSNELQVLNTKDVKLSVKATAGIEEKTRNIPGVVKETVGFATGYNFTYRKKNWSFLSNIEYYSKAFPGLNKGLRLHSHQITRNFKSLYGSVFYSANAINSTYFRDTLYNTDILKYNNERLGFTVGVMDRHTTLSLSSGIMNQTGIVSFGLSNMYFADINYSWMPGKNIQVMLNSQNAFKDDADIQGNDAYMTSSMASLRFWWFGFMGAYTTRPVFELESSDPVLKYYDETITGGPFISYNFFRNRLTGMVRYQLSKSVYDQVIRKSAGVTTNYNNQKFGTSVQFTANIPVDKTASSSSNLPFFEERYITLSLIQQLNIPVLTRKKYYDLKVTAYYDENNNGKRDNDEIRLTKTRIDIGDHEILYTDKKGTASYLNIEKETYGIKPRAVNQLGLIPVKGYEQSVIVDRNVEMDIPYNKGKVIQGSIEVFNDSFSQQSLSADRIKVTASDTSGKRFVAFSDISGNFSFHLPTGIYTISLNPAAYEATEFRPERMSYVVDLTKTEKESVHFVIRQKQRKVRFLEIN